VALRELFVCVKQSVAVEGAVSLSADERLLAPECRKWVPNEADAFALEQALRLREAGAVESVTCLTAGPVEAGAMLALCLAMGADRAVRIDLPEGAFLDGSATGALLGAAIERLGGRLVLAAQRSDDGRSGIVPAAIARALGAAYLSNVAATRFDGERVEVERKLERGNRQVWAAALPAVVAVEPGTILPRYVSVAALILARRRPVEELTAQSFGVALDALPQLTALQRLAPPRLRPKKTAALASGLSSADRQKLILGGTVGGTKEKRVLKGSPAELADEVVSLLRERELLSQEER